MNKTQHNRRWRLRFSLRTLFLFSLLLSGLIAWLSHNYRQYAAEQRLIESITSSMPKGSVVSRTTNGDFETLIGSAFM